MTSLLSRQALSQHHPSMAIAGEESASVDAILDQLDPLDRAAALVHDDWRALLEPGPPVEVMIVSLPILDLLSKFHGPRLQEMSRESTILLVLRLQDFLASATSMDLAGGFVFSDANLYRLQDSLLLARHGYSLLPAAVMMDIVSDKVRCDLLMQLSFLDLKILDMIRLARSNNLISSSLVLSEANIKTKVRAILKRLKFRNRTEAAVFAARHERTIRRLLARGPSRKRMRAPQ